MYEVTAGTDYDDKILEMHLAGKSRGEIAAEIGKAPNYVSKRLQKMRRWGWVKDESKKAVEARKSADVLLLFNAGADVPSIMRITGLNRPSVMERLTWMDEKGQLNRPLRQVNN
jgi:DNA-binding IclR family transcriptional regulator